MLSSDEGIKLVFFNGEVIGTILTNVDGITLGLDAGKELGSLDESFDSSDDFKLFCINFFYPYLLLIH